MAAELSQKIRNMSIVCAILVVFIHVPWDGAAGTVSWLMNGLFKSGLSMIAVPFFFVVSGWLLAKHFNERTWWRREVSKRIKSLLVPYFIWNTIAFGIMSVTQGHFSWIECLGLDFTAYPPLTPLWYVRCLFVLVCLSPILDWLNRRVGWAFLALVFLLAFFFCLKAPDPGSAKGLALIGWRGFPPYAVFYFSLGLYINGKEERTWHRHVQIVGLVGGAMTLIFRLVDRGDPVMLKCVWFAAIPFLVAGVWRVMPSAAWPKWLTGSAFPVYVMHFLWLAMGLKLLARGGICGDLKGLFVLCIGVGCSVFTSVLLQRFAPRLRSVLFGGR